MVKRWQFVSNQGEDGVGKDEKTRKIVRKTAMKAFRRNQRLERAKRFMQEGREGVDQCDLETTGEAAEDSCSEVLPQGLEQSGSLVLRQNQNGVEASVHAYNAGALLQQMALNEYPVAASFPWPREIVSLDPFGSSPLGTCRTWHHLFTHFVYVIAPMVQPLGINSHLNPVTTQWARRAMNDSALFHGILFHASVHIDKFQGKPWRSTTLLHRGEAIRLVSERLNDSDGTVSDETIAAVGWVGSEGNITGNVEGDQIHWKAIQKMLKTRGGLQALGWNGALELLLSMSSIISSMVAGTLPMIERPTLTGVELPDIPPSLIHHTPDILTVVEFGEDVMTLLRFMSELAITYCNLIHTPGVTAEEIIIFNKLRSGVEHRLLSIRVSSPSNSPGSQLEATVHEACRITALMCSNCIFREFIPIAVAFRGLEHGLLLALTEIERLGDLEDLGDFEELLLWVYFVGGMVSTTTETEWFAFRVAKSMANLGFQDWEEVENSLARCLWTEKMQNRYCVTFWDMVTRSRETSEEGAGYNATVGRCLE